RDSLFCSSRRRHTRFSRDWSSDVCSSDLHRIFGEEGFGDDIQTSEGVIWMLDPIDGTMNFVHQKRNFAISLGIFKDGVGQLGYRSEERRVGKDGSAGGLPEVSEHTT